MSRKSIVILIVGLILLVLTFVVFNNIYSTLVFTEKELEELLASGATELVYARAQKANTVQTLFYWISGLEIIITGTWAYKSRNQ